MKPAAPPLPENLHASAMVLGERGILVRGPSGAGKTRLVLALVDAGRRDGRFARLVADDRTLVSAYGLRLVARPHPALAGRVERRGLGIVPVEHEPACLLDLIVDLTNDPVPRFPEPEACETMLAGAKLPRLALPAHTATFDAASLVLTKLATLAPRAQPLAPFSLPRPPRCTR